MSGASYRIRAMDDEEAAIVAALVRRVFDAFNREQYGDNPERFLNDITEDKALDLLDDGVVLVAVAANDDIAGVIALDGEDHLEWLFVDAPHQRRGIASSLWETLRLWRPDAEAITVSASDHGAAWYAQAGFVPAAGADRPNRLVWRRG